MQDKYKIIGPFYDWVAGIFSAQQIDKCKVAMHEKIKPNDKILFAGVGHGKDAIMASELGAEVTVVDLSQTMLKKFQKGLKAANLRYPVKQIHDDILNVEQYSEYDMVFANFFLNVFAEEKMAQILTHLADLAKPNGYVVVGDFSVPRGGLFTKLFQKTNWYIADIFFWLVANNALHHIYNYPLYLKLLGLRVETIKHFKFLNINCYYSVLAKKE